MINESKPTISSEETNLNIGSGYSLLIGGIFKLIIGAVNTATSITNSSKVVPYVTWDNNTTTFDTETRTWDEMGAIMNNTSKQTSAITNTSKPA
jgi:hypothetical protein